MFNISPKITKLMDNQPMKYKQDLKPCNISNITQDTNEENGEKIMEDGLETKYSSFLVD